MMFSWMRSVGVHSMWYKSSIANPTLPFSSKEELSLAFMAAYALMSTINATVAVLFLVVLFHLLLL